MGVREACPQCASEQCKKNGHIHTGKQHHQCKHCGRQFVLQLERRVIDAGQRSVVEHLLLEKMSLHGICRAVGVSIRWLMAFMVARFRAAPEDLHVQLPSRPGAVSWRWVEAEVDAMHSVVQKKAHEQWLWLAHTADRGVSRGGSQS
jgi:transposase-like protein